LAVKQARAQLAAAKAGVTAAEIGLDTVNAKHGRLARLRDKQVISESAFEDIEGTQRSTKAQVSLAEAQVQLAEVGLESALANLSYTEVRAPFDGEVARRMVDEGARLSAMPPTPIVILVDDSELKVVGALPERDLPFVSAGTPVRVTVDAVRTDPIEAVVDRMDPIVDPVSRTAGVQVVLKNEAGGMQPGMSAELRLDLGTRKTVAVPDDVVLHSEAESDVGYVFVIKDNLASKRKVRLGVREGDLREIMDGLEADEVVVRGGQAKLRDGQTVIVDETKDTKR
jgi:HlyD family secretion protein